MNFLFFYSCLCTCQVSTMNMYSFIKKKKKNSYLKIAMLDFPGGPVDKNPPANAGDLGLKSDPGRSHML